jgi:hypothetical protein
MHIDKILRTAVGVDDPMEHTTLAHRRFIGPRGIFPISGFFRQ